MLFLMTISLTVSVTFFFIKHPLSMGFSLLTQTILVSLMTGLLNLNFWYSFILFLIMVGGMLILFIYMTSVASNEKFNLTTTMIGMIIILPMTTFSLIYLSMPEALEVEILTQMTQQITKKEWINSLTKFLTYPLNFNLIMLMSYLFLALIAVVKITDIKYGPLRTSSKN
uniref:NADH-ubiquinone oxidoreductase chain 6 n=1 Tax=Agrilus biguttatus TaxID=324823 RepID=A0A0S2MQ30_9COLE|nr:NADH deshydrogenase subunit 6 [Agrilus biguttatus]